MTAENKPDNLRIEDMYLEVKLAIFRDLVESLEDLNASLAKSLILAKKQRDIFEERLSRIAILGSGDMAYTSDFTTQVMGIVRGLEK